MGSTVDCGLTLDGRGSAGVGGSTLGEIIVSTGGIVSGTLVGHVGGSTGIRTGGSTVADGDVLSAGGTVAVETGTRVGESIVEE